MSQRVNLDFDDKVVKIWCKHDGCSLEEDFKSFREDGDAYQLATYAFGNNCEVKIFNESNLVIGATLWIGL